MKLGAEVVNQVGQAFGEIVMLINQVPEKEVSSDKVIDDNKYSFKLRFKFYQKYEGI